jgi:DNA-binding CsgD family transcriptional regulator
MAGVGISQAGLPTDVTPFIGRVRELAELQDLLRRTSWTTVTGPGGIGKTRLAIQALRGAGDPVIGFVPLDTVHEPGMVAPSVARALGVKPRPGESEADSIARALEDRDGVVLLDTCEHLVDAVAELGRQVLAANGRARFVATSQAVLGLPEERVYRVRPLGTDPDGEAAMFFTLRARDRQPDFAPGEGEAAAIVGLCQRLEGWPLGLELAAGWMDVLSPGQLLDRWEKRHQLLDNPGSVTMRQRSSAGAVEWSAALLPGAARRLAVRVSIFSGPFTLADVEALSEGGDPDPARPLRDLVNLSWLEFRSAGQPHYQMLGILRDWGRRELASTGSALAAWHALGNYVLAMAESAERDRFRAGSGNWPQRLGLASGTIDAVLAWCAREDPLTAARIATSLLGWWRRSGRIGEGRRWYQVIGTADGLPPVMVARVRCAEALVAMDIADYPAARDLAAFALPTLEADSDHLWAARALTAASTAAKYLGDTRLARRQLQQAIPHLEEHRDQQELAIGYNNLGSLAADCHELRLAEEAYLNSLRIKEELGDERSIALTLANLGDVCTQLGRVEDANRMLAEGLAVARRIPDEFLTAFIQINIGENLLASGRYALAADTFRAVISALAGMDNDVPRFRTLTVAGLSRALYLSGDTGEGMARLREARGLARQAKDQLLLQEIDDKAGAAGMEPQAPGAPMEPPHSLPLPAPVSSSPRGQKLTTREIEVLLLTARGRSNKEIAKTLGIKATTVQRHLANVYQKLAVNNKIEAINAALADGSLPSDAVGRSTTEG